MRGSDSKGYAARQWRAVGHIARSAAVFVIAVVMVVMVFSLMTGVWVIQFLKGKDVHNESDEANME